MKDREYWVDKLLLNWQAWISAPELPDKCPPVASGSIVGYTHMDNEASCTEMDLRLAEVTNSVIDALPTVEQMAIYRHYWIIAMFDADIDYSVALQHGKLHVGDGLEARGVYLGD